MGYEFPQGVAGVDCSEQRMKRTFLSLWIALLSGAVLPQTPAVGAAGTTPVSQSGNMPPWSLPGNLVDLMEFGSNFQLRFAVPKTAAQMLGEARYSAPGRKVNTPPDNNPITPSTHLLSNAPLTMRRS